MDPIKIFIGTEEAQNLPTQVLKYSIERRTESPVEFHLLLDIPLKISKKMYTGFSFYRFAIPQFCEYKGKAIYFDADMVVLGDIAELVSLPFVGKGALARPRPPASWYTSAMVLDCALLKQWDISKWETLITAGIASYKGTLWGEASGLTHKDFAPLPEYWNHLDTFDATTKNIHYTHVPHQPWKVPGHPYASIFLKELNSALQAGAVTKTDIDKEIASGHVYNGILKDAETQPPV